MFWVSRSLPAPCASVAVGQVASGLAVALPAAVRHAVLPLAAGAVGSDTDPAVPSTVLSWNVWLNSTVPAAARARGADNVVPTATALIRSVAAVARATIRRVRRRAISRLLFRLSAGRPGAKQPFRLRGPGGRAAELAYPAECHVVTLT